MLKPLVLVPGTHDYGDATPWWSPRGRWADPFLAAGYEFAGGEQFEGWDREVDGIIGPHRGWVAGGAALRYFIAAYCPVRPTVIAWSHGGNVVAHALVDLDTLVTVATPVRYDIAGFWEVQRRKMRRWIHFWCANDTWQYNGGGRGPMPLADENLEVSGLDDLTCHRDLLDAERILAAL